MIGKIAMMIRYKNNYVFVRIFALLAIFSNKLVDFTFLFAFTWQDDLQNRLKSLIKVCAQR